MEKSSSKTSFFSFNSPLKSNLKSSSAKARSLCWQKSVKEDNANWTTVDAPEPSADDFRRGRNSKRRCSAPSVVPLDFKSRKPTLKTIQMMKLGSSEVPSPSNSISEEHELTEDQRRELRKAFLMFEKGGKNKMSARDLGALLRCLGWNPSERELEEAKHELVVSFSYGNVCFRMPDSDSAEIQKHYSERKKASDGKMFLLHAVCVTHTQYWTLGNQITQKLKSSSPSTYYDTGDYIAAVYEGD
ncbi:uncharacterized protein LOC123541111 [Mercenaria mercenaria]|uniref:uncharacterized protein LOC123541111 n=1 Tax=Mercenaria mercenaria TaxID=6596 RepID=UPI00234EE375|nr:uncharacterized protein LOC123541111 [Mercenaria mercenaria]